MLAEFEAGLRNLLNERPVQEATDGRLSVTVPKEAPMIGRDTRTVVPRPLPGLVASMLPPCASMRCLLMVAPSGPSMLMGLGRTSSQTGW